jgi:hypothetical protein
VTFLALGLFVWMVHRTSQATRDDGGVRHRA